MITDDRQEILARLRAGDDAGGGASPTIVDVPPAPQLAAYPDRTAAFLQAAAANSMAVQAIAGEAEIPQAVATYCQQNQLPPQAVCEPSLQPLNWHAAGVTATSRTAQLDDVCGVTRANAAAADTAALLITDNTPYALSISLLPPHHIAILHATDLVDDIAQLWTRLPQPLPRGCRLIAGPSRTADIEQTLTLGVHGPIAVCVLLVNNATPHG